MGVGDRSLSNILHDVGRSVIGGLVLGMPLLFTMETWWLAWRLPTYVLLGFSFLGLLGVFALVHVVGFEREKKGARKSLGEVVRDFLELVLVSAVTSLAVLLLFGIVEWGDSLANVVRLAAIEIVPVAMGGAIANAALRGAEEDGQRSFAEESGTFALGAVFFAFNIAPTEEMELMAAHAGWARLALVVPLAVGLTYVALYELEFRGQRGRRAGSASRWLQVGEATAGYAIALVASAVLLAGYGHFSSTPLLESLQMVVVLSFVASLGGAAARVVI